MAVLALQKFSGAETDLFKKFMGDINFNKKSCSWLGHVTSSGTGAPELQNVCGGGPADVRFPYFKLNLVPGWTMSPALVRAHLRCKTFAAAKQILKN